MKILFIGGPGNISSSTIDMLVEHDCIVGVLKRSSNTDKRLDKDVTFFKGDRNDSSLLRDAIDSFNPDIVADFVCFTPQQAESISSILEKTNITYLFVSTVNVTGYPLSRIPMREHDPQRPTIGEYAENKRLCEKFLQNKKQEKRLSLIITRPAMSFGPKSMVSFFRPDGIKYIFPRLRAGREVIVPGDGTTLIPLSCAYNTGRMIARIIMEPEKSIGKTYHCAHPEVISYNDYMAKITEASGGKLKPVYIPTNLLMQFEDPYIDRRIIEGLTPYNRVYSIENFLREFPDFTWDKTIEQGIGEYIEYHYKNNLFPNINQPIIEDEIIFKWKKTIKRFSIT